MVDRPCTSGPPPDNFTVTFSGWSDPDGPTTLTYEVRDGDTVIAARSPNSAAPAIRAMTDDATMSTVAAAKARSWRDHGARAGRAAQPLARTVGDHRRAPITVACARRCC